MQGLLNERSRRRWAAAEARSHGRGGIAAVSRATGISEGTVRRGLAELELAEVELVDNAQLVAFDASTGVGEVQVQIPAPIADRYLAAEADRIAARASTFGTRRQYASIYRSFATWLAAQLGRPPLVGDLDADVIAAYGRHLTARGGRGGAPAAPATVRV